MHSISPYSLRVLNPNVQGAKREDKLIVLNKIGSSDLLEMLEAFVLNNTSKLVDIEKTKQTFVFSNIDCDKTKRTISGYMETGHYGLRTDIVEVGTGTKAFEKDTIHAELIKHFFHIAIPIDVNEGIAIFHSYRTTGIKTLFFDKFSEFFQKQHAFTVQMNPLSYERAFDKWLDANAKEIRLVRFDAGDDLADRVKGLGHVETDLKLKPKRLKTFGTFKSLLKIGTDQNRVIEHLAPLCKEVKTVVELNGKKRTFVVGDSAKTSVCQIEVPDDMQRVGGNPEYNAMNAWCAEIASEYLNNMYPKTRAIA